MEELKIATYEMLKENVLLNEISNVETFISNSIHSGNKICYIPIQNSELIETIKQELINSGYQLTDYVKPLDGKSVGYGDNVIAIQF